MATPKPNKQLIAEAMRAQLANITAFDAPYAFRAIVHDKIRVNIDQFGDQEIPAVQIIDVSTIEEPERHRGKIAWQIVCQIVVKETLGFPCDQTVMWQYEQALKECIMNKPDLGLFGPAALPNNSAIIHVLPSDRASDLHTFGPYYVSNVGFSVLYYEALTRRTC